jgi:hypothetical protein
MGWGPLNSPWMAGLRCSYSIKSVWS